MTSLCENEMRVELRRQMDADGGCAAWCRKTGVSETTVSLAINGHRGIPETIANAMGFISEKTFRKIRG